MPEGIEIELYRGAAEAAVGRTISSVETPDSWFIKDGLTADQVKTVLTDQKVTGTDRIGKLLLVTLGSAPPLGLRFGMTGRIVVDGLGPIDKLEYGPSSTEEKWVRFRLRFVEGGELAIHDPRRLGGVTFDPKLDDLGADLYSIDFDHFRDRVLVGKVAVKSRLLDQKRIAGVGNLICDEALWRSALRPDRAANSLTESEKQNLFSTLKDTVRVLTERGGSHTGDLQAERHKEGRCPVDGADLLIKKVGGRTSYFCEAHQK